MNYCIISITLYMLSAKNRMYTRIISYELHFEPTTRIFTYSKTLLGFYYIRNLQNYCYQLLGKIEQDKFKKKSNLRSRISSGYFL